MSQWGWPSDLTLGGYISQTQVPFFSICLANRCCEMMFWVYDPHYNLKGPTLVCSSQKRIILTLGSGVLDTPCWLLQAVPPPKCQMLLCLLSDLICHLHPPWGQFPIIKLRQDYPHHPPGGLSQQLYGTSARHGCPRRTAPLFECRMSVLMLDRGAFPCWDSMSVAAGWRKTSFLSVVLSKPLFLSKPVPFPDTVTFPLCKLVCSQAVPYCLSCLMSNKSLIVPSWQNW